MSQDKIVRERLDAVLDRSNIPTWVDQTELRAELFKVVDRMLKAERGATILAMGVQNAFDKQVDADRGLTDDA